MSEMQTSKDTIILILICSFISFVGMIIGFSIGVETGILILITVLLLGLCFATFIKSRYRKLSKMAEQIDTVLHNAEHIYISDSDEGELAVLQSEIHKMTSRIRDQNETLMREKEHLANSLADIAHQLRTPLTSVNMVLSFLDACEDASERKELLREATDLLSRMEALLTALLKLSRLDAGVITFRKEEVSVTEIVNSALMSLQIPIEIHNIKLETDIPKNAVIIGDKMWLSEALQNIIKNCIEKIGNDGKIEIACTDTLIYTEISVHDSGDGIRPEDIPHLFERFYRGKNSTTAGYGIGLSLSYTIVARHSGMLKAANHPQGGAVFTMKFLK